MPAVLDVLPAEFALDLAALASHRGTLQLEQWLASRIASLQLPFVDVCPLFILLLALKVHTTARLQFICNLRHPMLAPAVTQ